MPTIIQTRNLTYEQKQELQRLIDNANNANDLFHATYDGTTIALTNNSDAAIDILASILGLVYPVGIGSTDVIAEGIKRAKRTLQDRGSRIDAAVDAAQVGTAVNTSWQTAITPLRRDPLAIDLDNDGIETLGIPSTGSPVLFDHDADGTRTGTGWVAPDDAWLVLDRDGNGSIDSGRELFGVDTAITVTEVPFGGSQAITYTRTARTGFEALRALDTGNGTAGSAGYGDGVFDANDAAFTQVRLWQDLNQDGISQSNELSSLADKSITAIGLTASTTTTDLGNGNTLTGQATVTRSTGSSTQVGSVDLKAGNLNLADNPFYREFSDSIPLTETARALPEMGGSGWVRDLREAMSLGRERRPPLSLLRQQGAA